MRSKLQEDGTPPSESAAIADLLSLTDQSSPEEIESRYRLARGKLSQALEQKFPNRESLLDFIQDSLLTNAILANQQFAENVDNLEPIQAAQAASLYVGKFVELQKARATQFKTEPLSIRIALELKNTMSKLHDMGISSKNLQIIDVEPLPSNAPEVPEGGSETDEVSGLNLDEE